MAARSATVPTSTPREIHPWVAEGQQRIRFGVFSGPWAEWPALLEWVQTIEPKAFDSFWLGDHTMDSVSDCWTVLAALATHTSRLRLGPLVSCIYYRPPALLARQAADVDRLSSGRLVLGLGIGDIPREFAQLGLGEPPLRERAIAMAETIALVRGLWSGQPVTLHGQFVQATEARLGTRLVQQPHVPLLIAGGGERVTLRQAAEHADMCNFGPSGATGNAWGLPDVRRKLAALQQHCLDVGRPYSAVLRSYICGVVAGGTDAAVAAKLARRADANRLAEVDPAAGTPDMPRRFTTHYTRPGAEHLAHVFLAGTPPQLVAYYRALIETGMQYFFVSGDGETLNLLVEEVIPHLR